MPSMKSRRGFVLERLPGNEEESRLGTMRTENSTALGVEAGVGETPGVDDGGKKRKPVG